MRARLKALNFKDWDTMFYNNLLSIPVLTLASLVVEDWSSANLDLNLCVSGVAVRAVVFSSLVQCTVCSPAETRNFLLFAIMVSGAAAVFISYTTAWCMRATSSTTYRCVFLPYMHDSITV